MLPLPDDALLSTRAGVSVHQAAPKHLSWRFGLQPAGRRRLRSFLDWILLGAILFFARKVGPVYWSAARFQYALYETARDGATHRADVQRVRERVLLHAREFAIPLDRDSLDVQINARERLVTIRAPYRVPVTIASRTWMLKFSPSASQHPDPTDVRQAASP